MGRVNRFASSHKCRFHLGFGLVPTSSSWPITEIMSKSSLTTTCGTSSTVRGDRRPSPTEAELLDSFIKSLPKGSRSHSAPDRMLLRELEGPQGRPDLVDVHFRALPSSMSLDVLSMSLRSPAKARILALLRHRAPRRSDYLEKFTGFTRSVLQAHLQELKKAGLVDVSKSSAASLTCPLPWTMADIVVYEGKLTNWRRAIHQALGYRSFSHHVWIVMPESGALNALKLAPIFRTNGIGLISVHDDGTKHIEITGRRLRPASRRLYLMAVGTLVSKFVYEGRRLHRRIRPESIEGL